MIDWPSLCRALYEVMMKREARPLLCSLVQKQHMHQKRLSYQLSFFWCHLKTNWSWMIAYFLRLLKSLAKYQNKQWTIYEDSLLDLKSKWITFITLTSLCVRYGRSLLGWRPGFLWPISAVWRRKCFSSIWYFHSLFVSHTHHSDRAFRSYCFSLLRRLAGKAPVHVEPNEPAWEVHWPRWKQISNQIPVEQPIFYQRVWRPNLTAATLFSCLLGFDFGLPYYLLGFI